MYIIDFFFKCWNSLKVRSYHKIYLPYLKRQFLKCGEDVVIDSGSRIAGKNHIEIGDHVYVGPGGGFLFDSGIFTYRELYKYWS